MATKEALSVMLESLGKKTYYEILRVAQDATAGDIQAAFHDFSLLYHPDLFVGAEVDVSGLASEIYKRGVEAYRCLSRPALRERYDRGIARGRVRMDASRISLTPPPSAAPRARARTLEAVASTAAGKQRAGRADRLIDGGQLERARLELVGACQCEPDNEELAERLQLLYEALALEPS